VTIIFKLMVEFESRSGFEEFVSPESGYSDKNSLWILVWKILSGSSC